MKLLDFITFNSSIHSQILNLWSKHNGRFCMEREKKSKMRDIETHTPIHAENEFSSIVQQTH